MSLTISKSLLCTLKSLHEFFAFFLGDKFLGKDKSSKSIKSEVLAGFLKGWSCLGLDFWFHYNFCTLKVIEDLLGSSWFQQNAHLLGLTSEWETRKNIILFNFSFCISQEAIKTIAFNKRHVKLESELYHGNLIRTWSFKLRFLHATNDRLASGILI